MFFFFYNWLGVYLRVYSNLSKKHIYIIIFCIPIKIILFNISKSTRFTLPSGIGYCLKIRNYFQKYVLELKINNIVYLHWKKLYYINYHYLSHIYWRGERGWWLIFFFYISPSAPPKIFLTTPLYLLRCWKNILLCS